MNEKKFLMIFAVALVLITSGTVVFVESDIKTHVYNFLNSEMKYCYSLGTFETLDEAQVFIDTFQINETL